MTTPAGNGLTTEQIQATVDQLERIQADLEAAVKTAPEGSLRREALAMASGWLVYVTPSLRNAIEHEP
jgi:hypothetical protein